MGEPKHTNNVRRIDFAKAGAKQSRLRTEESATRTQDSDRSDRDRLKIVPLPEPRTRRRHRSDKPSQNALLAVIVILAALLGALIAAVLLDPTL
jgi:hypothetical protein